MKQVTVKGITTSLLLYALMLCANQTTFSQYVCQISGASITQTGSLTASDATQAGRVVRGGIPSTCVGKTNTLQNSTAVNQDNYTFTAPVTGCATLDFDATACGGATTQPVAYSTYNPASPATNVIGDLGFSTIGVGSFSFPVTAGQPYTIVIHDIIDSPNVFCTSYSFKITYRTSCQQPGFDRANDGKADLAVFTPGALGSWSNVVATGGTTETRQFGQTSDIPVSGDYTGDGQNDLSVYRPSNNTWYYATNQTTPNSNFVGRPWGVASDKPVPGDYDADGKADIAIWRPSNGTYYVLRSSDNSLFTAQWGQSGDTPVMGDFDGDLKTDFVVVRPNQSGESSLVWYVLGSNYQFGFAYFARWGSPGDYAVPADYDGNGKADIAIFRPSTGLWAAIPSSTANAPGTTSIGVQWGTTNDIPQPADYDGDGIVDQAVFRPSTNVWYIRNSGSNTATITPLGTAGAVPATAPYPVSTVP